MPGPATLNEQLVESLAQLLQVPSASAAAAHDAAVVPESDERPAKLAKVEVAAGGEDPLIQPLAAAAAGPVNAPAISPLASLPLNALTAWLEITPPPLPVSAVN